VLSGAAMKALARFNQILHPMSMEKYSTGTVKTGLTYRMLHLINKTSLIKTVVI